jgi:hypothetical protein
VAPYVESLVPTAEVVLAEATLSDLPKSIEEVFFDWLKPADWIQLWQKLSISAQTRLLEVLFLALPGSQLKLLDKLIGKTIC